MSPDHSWLRRFWLVLTALAIVSAATAFYYTRDPGREESESTYVSVQVKPQRETGQIIICKLSLLVDSEQESGIQGRKAMLEAVVSQTLLDAYQREPRPTLSEVRQSLHSAINSKLPRKLQVQEVLIQELLAGIS